MNESRTKNSIRNAVSGFIYKILGIIAPFILRTVILNIMGVEYLGLNGLFSSILQILNLTELGLTSAIVYSLYEPIEKKDYYKTSAILNLIRKAYLIIGISILVMGILLMPFLGKLIKGNYPSELNLQILFLIYLINTCISYIFFSYRNCLLTATQRNDIKTNINSVIKILELILQIVILIIWHNMYLYVSVQVICTLINNLCSYYITNKMYPQYLCDGKLNKSERKKILLQIIGILFDKVCCVSRTSFDSIFVSFFIGLEIVAKYENYSYIANALYSVINILAVSLIASVGNSVASETIEKNYNNMKQLDFIFAWIYGWCAIALFCLYQPFMELWTGVDMMFSNDIVILFVIYFYALCMGLVRAIYVQATGIWWKEKYRAIFETVCNLLLNIIFVNMWGLKGIVVGTCVSLIIVNFIYGSRYIFKFYFQNNGLLEYYKNHLLYVFCTLIFGYITWQLCLLVNKPCLVNLLYRAIICLIVPNFMCLILTRRTKKWIHVTDLLKKVMRIR